MTSMEIIDLAALCIDDWVYILINNGDGTFHAGGNCGMDYWVNDIFASDLNCDGFKDLVVTYWESGSISIALNNGDGTFQAHDDYVVGGRPFAAAAADFDVDGDNDLALANINIDSVSILLNRTLTLPGEIDGAVTEIDGTTPIDNVIVKALQSYLEVKRDTTDTNGQYSLTNLSPGLYEVRASKDGYETQTQQNIEVISGQALTLNIQLSQWMPPCAYVPGDVNGSNTFNGLDVTYGVNYFNGGAIPPYFCECAPDNTWFVSGDVNGSCSFNGLDVTYMVNYFRGGTAPIPCADCPPPGLSSPMPKAEMDD